MDKLTAKHLRNPIGEKRSNASHRCKADPKPSPSAKYLWAPSDPWVYIQPSPPPLYISMPESFGRHASGRTHLPLARSFPCPSFVFSSSLSSSAFLSLRFSLSFLPPSGRQQFSSFWVCFLVSSRPGRVRHCLLGIKNIIFWLLARR